MEQREFLFFYSSAFFYHAERLMSCVVPVVIHTYTEAYNCYNQRSYFHSQENISLIYAYQAQHI